jgi:hypothetical protein
VRKLREADIELAKGQSIKAVCKRHPPPAGAEGPRLGLRLRADPDARGPRAAAAHDRGRVCAGVPDDPGGAPARLGERARVLGVALRLPREPSTRTSEEVGGMLRLRERVPERLTYAGLIVARGRCAAKGMRVGDHFSEGVTVQSERAMSTLQAKARVGSVV